MIVPYSKLLYKVQLQQLYICVYLKYPLFPCFPLRLLTTDVAAGLKMPVIWILTPQQWVPQVYHHALSTTYYYTNI